MYGQISATKKPQFYHLTARINYVKHYNGQSEGYDTCFEPLEIVLKLSHPETVEIVT